MVYINQHDYPHLLYICNTGDPDEEKHYRTTFPMSACGICSTVMLVDRLTDASDFGVVEALELNYQCGANHAPGTDYKVYAPAICERFGLRYVTTNDIEEVRRCLRTGGCVVANSGGDREGYKSVFSQWGHYFVVISEEEDGRFCVLDPDLEPGKFDAPETSGKVEVRGKFCLCSGEVLIRDCDNRDPGFFCFWRK